jgi:hypothetical protein
VAEGLVAAAGEVADGAVAAAEGGVLEAAAREAEELVASAKRRWQIDLTSISPIFDQYLTSFDQYLTSKLD